jgi:hypothetical protein
MIAFSSASDKNNHSLHQILSAKVGLFNIIIKINLSNFCKNQLFPVKQGGIGMHY